MICKYFLPFCRLSSAFLDSIFWYPKVLNWIKSNLPVLFFFYFFFSFHESVWIYFIDPSSNSLICVFCCAVNPSDKLFVSDIELCIIRCRLDFFKNKDSSSLLMYSLLLSSLSVNFCFTLHVNYSYFEVISANFSIWSISSF